MVLLRAMNELELKWLIRVLLKQMKVNLFSSLHFCNFKKPAIFYKSILKLS